MFLSGIAFLIALIFVPEKKKITKRRRKNK